MSNHPVLTDKEAACFDNLKTMNRGILLAPITNEEIEWRIQSTTKDKSKTIVVPYLNNRVVMERFDKAFGWDNWSGKDIPIEGGFLCEITVDLGNGKKVTKSDGASKTGIEPIKGGISDAMKRCAVQFGLGRDLYDYPKIMITGEHKYIPDWAENELAQLVVKKASNQQLLSVIILKEGNKQQAATPKTTLPELLPGTDEWSSSVEYLTKHGSSALAKLEAKKFISPQNKLRLLEQSSPK